MNELLTRPFKVRRCRVCKCTEVTACMCPERGACWWVGEDLCSHCVKPDTIMNFYDDAVAQAEADGVMG